ncbi:hypothetical protein MUK42_15927 [Musa troglodytarum]|uniref:Uncharacterized protein n=1 Tax=Musa troglodytarum TaxID=320322 RepID=A0A9E7GV69_9LILI|nr:hypothetical protein MUK42_09565 [Musa troglodytarum]URE19538.1 hypothetical protein MUK42_09565 [Musa troglodytarum]URE21695.1 hypothetical protein MUK42_15927 [Musa troglodytarum]URE21697.1 hypothetical protein MUK42_15927 [Musa troglodytarum]URE21700.1 hypothetical protein MUK42_15927 [Musa troglodytarum]
MTESDASFLELDRPMEPSSWDDAPLLEPEGRDLIGTGNPDHLLSQLAWNGVDLSPTRSLAVAFGLYALSRFAMLTNASSAAECCYYKMLVRRRLPNGQVTCIYEWGG